MKTIEMKCVLRRVVAIDAIDQEQVVTIDAIDREQKIK